ncbi:MULTISPECIES: hypothetical protein [Mesorhizobium]|uniref:hypothetical protein n=2 Tax=Phyllobacteriaceae TaxID=69277 RepID=UPI000B315E16|nr:MULTISPECIES: hypothetical protein [Mesorhizobium]MBE1711808.1 hypothetical protein [Mesorhizobium japonicum]WIE92715.1 hypothetical protein P9270_005940 [Mesorhizobium sp. WSM4875]MBE1718037.1 hypothetical protein [Mesorhizobium japonicum]MBZ9799848.1 hypothetical protein [Mesorhizobium sp. ES1-4]MDF3211913.1 hypothetical protein [Mesorhizobium sp. LMG15046]
MTTQQRALGIIGLEIGLPPREFPPPQPESVFNPATFDFPIIIETAAGALEERVIPGDASLEPAYIAAARRLVERGAVAITGDCGFSIRYQAAVAASVEVPVAMSSLLLAPTLLRQLPADAKLAVVAADSRHCGKELLGIDSSAEARVVIGGIEGDAWPAGVVEMESEVAACVARLGAAHPGIAALLFECTLFPMVTSAIRRRTGLPIYDAATLYRMTFASVA